MTSKFDPNTRDLDWTAFRYIAGELPELEAVEFEGLLAQNQAAREAVASAYELCQAVHHVSSPEPTVSLPGRSLGLPGRSLGSSHIPQRGWRFAVAGLALIALVVLLWTRGSEPERTVRTEGDRSAPQELASFWAATPVYYSSNGPLVTVDDGLTETAWDDLAEAVGGQELDPPSWMVAAVASLDAASETESEE